jgi:hypothetical protein
VVAVDDCLASKFTGLPVATTQTQRGESTALDGLKEQTTAVFMQITSEMLKGNWEETSFQQTLSRLPMASKLQDNFPAARVKHYVIKVTARS